jgi:hypothetical protein
MIQLKQNNSENNKHKINIKKPSYSQTIANKGYSGGEDSICNNKKHKTRINPRCVKPNGENYTIRL